MSDRVDLRQAFLAKQNALLAALNVTVQFTSHGTTIGDASEANWGNMLREFLPMRYGVGPVFVVDSNGARSQQTDLAVYDRQYSPLFFKSPSGTLFVPAESVYAVFEVKPSIDKPLAEYAAEKIASVRRLHRTSAAIVHAGGTYDPRRPEQVPIIGGLLAVRSGWSHVDGQASVRALTSLRGDHRVDLGCVLDALSFEVLPGSDEIAFSDTNTQLIYFVLRLFQRLQRTGTALAAEIDKYERFIDPPSS